MHAGKAETSGFAFKPDAVIWGKAAWTAFLYQYLADEGTFTKKGINGP